MIYYEVVEDVGDGYAATRRFRTEAEAKEYIEFINNEDDECVCLNGIDLIDTESGDFYHIYEE